ncbi:hypothetical protein ccbrp13_56090 [Ktedonobacteria bacterium brp13]|nr:hypothetical protein ccbrp13_56090 [Ktedonobacteria bacterium brp13]
MIKLLTGEKVHDAYALIDTYASSWLSISKELQENYDNLAKILNQQLGLCESCGERPQDGILHEVAGDNVCTSCITPPQDDPKAQYMHLISNPDGTLAGVITPPAGMSLEAYKAQLQEEMKGVYFVLGYGPGDDDHITATNFSKLYDAIDKHVPYPTEGHGSFYYIRVCRLGEDIGHGDYYRTRTEIIVRSETGAAQNLNSTLYAYAFNHKV